MLFNDSVLFEISFPRVLLLYVCKGQLDAFLRVKEHTIVSKRWSSSKYRIAFLPLTFVIKRQCWYIVS